MRVAKGVTRQELADAVGLSYASLKRLEHGLAVNAPLWWYRNCAIALGVELEEILDDNERRWRVRDKAPRPPGPEWLETKGQQKPI